MNEILQYILLGLAVLIIANKIVINVSPRYRRWVYSKDGS
jgi:hypothetical protein